MIKFKDWLAKREPTTEMTSSASVSGGMTSTADIAQFKRPLGMGMIRRGIKPRKEHLPKLF